MPKHIRIAALASLLVAAAASQAAFTLVERSTSMNVGWQYGYDWENYPGSNGFWSTATNTDYTNLLTASESHSGLSEFGPWESGISYELAQDWTPTSNGFLASGSTFISCYTSGGAFANVESRFPGNELILHFANDAETTVSFFGASSWMGTVHLEKLQSFGWENVYTNPDMGGFNYVGTMGVGEYRIVAYGESVIDGNMTGGASWQYQIAAVPEPATMAVLGLGLAAMIRRRRR